MAGTLLSSPRTVGLSGNVQKPPWGKGMTPLSESNSPVFIRLSVAKRQNYTSFCASEEKIQRGSAVYSRSHRLLIKGQKQGLDFPPHEAVAG